MGRTIGTSIGYPYRVFFTGSPTQTLSHSVCITNSSSTFWKKTNQRNHTRLPSPTQLLIHGQWWSWVRTQRLQSLQCFYLKGCTQLHFVHVGRT